MAPETNTMLKRFTRMQEKYPMEAGLVYNFLKDEDGNLNILVMPPLEEMIYIPFVFESIDVIVEKFQKNGY